MIFAVVVVVPVKFALTKAIQPSSPIVVVVIYVYVLAVVVTNCMLKFHAFLTADGLSLFEIVIPVVKFRS